MFTHPDRIRQLATQHHRQMLAEASQWQLWDRDGIRQSMRLDVATVARRLARAIARTGRRERTQHQPPVVQSGLRRAPGHRLRLNAGGTEVLSEGASGRELIGKGHRADVGHAGWRPGDRVPGG